MNRSLATKIAVSFGVILIILIIVAAISIQNIKRLQQEASSVTHTNKVLKKIEEVFGDFKDAETSQRGYIITGKENYLQPYNTALIELPKDIENLRELTIDNPKQQQRIVELESLTELKLGELSQTIQLRRDIGFDTARTAVLSDVGKRHMDNIRVMLNSMTSEENTLMVERTLTSARGTKNARIIIIFVTIGSILIVILLTIYLTRNIANPIREISGIANKISTGDLRSNIPKINRKDEVGILYSAFKKMAENLREQNKEVMEAVNVLTSMVTEISTTTTQLASSSQETSTAVSESSTTIEELKQTAGLANEKSKDISENAKQTVDVAKNGEEAVEETSRGIEHISDQMSLIASSIIKLSEQSQAIGEITNSINDLAEQSNLLAVNASIEAVKAGEEGKGFSVVAEEIRSLAEQSKQATQQVREIIVGIRKATSKAVMATEEGSKAVETGQKQSTKAGNAIKTLTETIDETAKAMIQIETSTQQQFTGIEQVNEASGNISTASTHNLESTKQLETAAANLDELGQNLKKLMEIYKV